MISGRALELSFHGRVVHRAFLPGMLVCTLYLGAPSFVQAQSGDGPVAGVIVDQFNELYGDTADVIITTACLEGNPFVPADPPDILGTTSTLSGCKLDIPEGSLTPDDDINQLITVLPNNYKDGNVLTSVFTYGSGSNTALEFDVTVRAVSKDAHFGLANPGLFDASPNFDPSSSVASTADGYCTSIDGSFDCAKIEPCSTCSSVTACGELIVQSEPDPSPFCEALTGLLEGSYNLETNPLAYAVSTTMATIINETTSESKLAQPGSVTLRLCPGFQAQCLSQTASPMVANARVTSTHTQNAAVDTPRLRMPYY